MKKIFSGIALTMAVCVGLTACSGKNNEQKVSEEIVKTTSDTYPLETDAELRWWVPSGNNFYEKMEEMPFWQYLQEDTGVKIKVEYPSDGNASQAVALMLASDDMPDIIQRNWGNGTDKQIDDGVIVDITPYMEKGIAPNYKKIMDEHPEYKPLATTVDGRYFGFLQILGDELLTSYKSYFIREDLLKKAGLEKPETIDEWENVLKTFKEMGVEAPITLRLSRGEQASNGPFMAALGLIPDFYHDGDTVKYGFAEQSYRKWVELMRKWYSNGWLDKDFVDTAASKLSAQVTNGKVGAYIGSIGGEYGSFLDALPANSTLKWDPVKVPVAKKGERAVFNQKQNMVHSISAVVTGQSKHKEIAVRVLDYGYSEEGQRLWNFGREGISYTMEKDENGNLIPTYSDLLKDPAKREGRTFGQQLGLYANVGNPISVQSKYYIMQNYAREEQLKALEYATDTDADKYKMPNILFTGEEELEILDILTPVETYIDETIVKIITGRLPLEHMDEYYKQIEKLGINNAIDMYQKAYDRYRSKTLN